ncbi:calcium/sodium antiporter [Kordiimonas lacus]|uniref:Cation:H+ antiporter n=1 Tax=Kordiimonas lacus TaxID=637679 RepID=A0A1G7BKS7_9PROT|nr:calcium/sodium antiporter [Kordiimonas lacus]SDE27522.1 cation:H+ antiporter [Kordiimonas lacus]
MAYLQLIGGLVLLFLGGEALLRGSVALSKRFGLSTLLVSMVVVGFGTSAPEFLVSILAALQGAPSLALGNVVGSNIANILLILGLSAAIAPVACDDRQIMRDAVAVFVASLLLGLLTFLGQISFIFGLMLLLSLIGYLTFVYKSERRAQLRASKKVAHDVEEDIPAAGLGFTGALLVGLAGLVALAGGAHLLVQGATEIALAFGVSEAVIGLTIVAVGTSLPELATALVSAYRGHAGVVLGNVLGSNLFNMLGVLGATAMAATVPLDGKIAHFDVWVGIGVAAILLPAIRSGKRLSRREGILFLTLYAGYIYSTLITNGG